jgi:hypothetical protein
MGIQINKMSESFETPLTLRVHEKRGCGYNGSQTYKLIHAINKEIYIRGNIFWLHKMFEEQKLFVLNFNCFNRIIKSEMNILLRRSF